MESETLPKTVAAIAGRTVTGGLVSTGEVLLASTTEEFICNYKGETEDERWHIICSSILLTNNWKSLPY